MRAIVFALGIVATLTSPTDQQGCDQVDFACWADNSGGEVGAGGSYKPGDPGIAPPVGSDDDWYEASPVVPGAPGSGATRPPPPSLCTIEEDTFPIWQPPEGLCETPDPGAGPVTIPYPTVTDLASFRPNAPTLTGEPFTAGILGKPTNFLSTATTHELTGQLFGYPVTVEFTPVAYNLDYGDGTSATLTDASTSWEANGLPQFTPTAAAHTYDAKGLFTASATVNYSARVNFNGSPDWLDVAGVVVSAPSTYDLTIYEVVTALVDKDCIANPGGIGCP